MKSSFQGWCFEVWIAEFKVWHKGSPLLPLSEKYDVHMFSQYLNTFEENGQPKLMRLAKFWGVDKEKAISELLNHPDSDVIHREGDVVFFAQKAIRSFHTLVADQTVFFLGPVLEEKGFQWWKVGSNKKENLTRLLEKIQKQKIYATAELVSIKNRKTGFVSFSSVPQVDAQDLDWWHRALDEGYYEYPRKISLESLAKKIGVPYTTLKDHLRRTENQLMHQIAQET